MTGGRRTVHRTQNLPKHATRGAAVENAVGQYALHRHSTETWLTLYRKAHARAVMGSSCGTGWPVDTKSSKSLHNYAHGLDLFGSTNIFTMTSLL